MKRRAIDRLVNWMGNTTKKPLFIFGARRVGKTYLVKDFGKEYFKDVMYVNCESNVFANDVFNENVTFEMILRKLELIFNKSVNKVDTLIVFDEIEKNEKALRAVLDIVKSPVEYNIICTISCNSDYGMKEFNLPTKDLEIMSLYPLSFEEFLLNTGHEDMVDKIYDCYKNNSSLPGLMHKQAFDLYYDYLSLGGMPEVIKEYIETGAVINAIDYHKTIIESYKSDMLRNKGAVFCKKIIATYSSIPSQLYKKNKKFKYKLVEEGGSSNHLAASIDWLVNNDIAYKCNKVESFDTPEITTNENSFVLYLNDVGLLTNLAEFPIYFIRNRDAVNEKMFDMLSENYVACALKSNSIDLIFWKNNYDSNLDFVIKSKTGLIIPVEVKSNNSIKSRSLSNFMNEYQPKYGIRFSTKNFSFKNNIKNIPLYAAFCINKRNLD